MAKIVFKSDPNFAKEYRDLLNSRSEDVDDAAIAAAITIKNIKNNGFAAVCELSKQFDDFELNEQNVKITEQQINEAVNSCDKKIITALEVAAQRIYDFHEKSLPSDNFYHDESGIGLGWRWNAVDAAGLYAPGGKAAYPSSVIMNAIPAKVAGVNRIMMTTPPNKLHENPAILAAAKIAGVTEIYGLGGAQAIAAMAYGAGPIEPVDVIVGPGNAYVSAAKKLVFGDVGIDSVAGPSEVFIIADKNNDAKIIACDLLAQCEHDEMAQGILFTDDLDFAKSVSNAADELIVTNMAGELARASWDKYSMIVIIDKLSDAIDLVNLGAPEHLEIATDNPDEILPFIKHTGSIFIGKNTPESLGDYVAGPNHVLPTGRRARFSSGLSCLNFMKRTTLLRASESGLKAIGPYASTLAKAEGLSAHANSIDLRLKK